MLYSGVLFDFNGTLLNDSDKHEAAWRAFAREMYGREITGEEMRLHVHGRNNAYIHGYFSGKQFTPGQLAALTEQKEAVYRRLCAEDPAGMQLAPGAQWLLDELKKRHIPCNLATASCKSNVDFYMESFGLGRWFDRAKIVYDDGIIHGKPEPDFYLRAADAIGVPANQCLVFEDSVPGVRAAKAAGATVIAVALREGEAHPADMLEVHAVIHDFRECTNLMDIEL